MFCSSAVGSCVATAESVASSCGVATPRWSIFYSLAGGSCVATAKSIAGSCGAATSRSSIFCSSTVGSCVGTAESIASSCGAATSRMSVFYSSVVGSYVETIESVAGSCGATTCYTSSWVSKFGGSTTGSCVAATFFEKNDVTKSWASCILVPEGETGKGSGPWDCGGLWGFRVIGGEFGMVVTVSASIDILIRLRGKKVGKAVVFLL